MVNSVHVDCALVLIFLLNSVLGKQACDIKTVVYRQCHVTETCVPAADSTKAYCECQPGYTRVNSTFCTNTTLHNGPLAPRSSRFVDKEGNGKNGHLVAGILIPIFLITVVISGIYVTRKYDLVSYIRSKIYQRNNNYDEVMIGQDIEDDDPPLR